MYSLKKIPYRYENCLFCLFLKSHVAVEVAEIPGNANTYRRYRMSHDILSKRDIVLGLSAKFAKLTMCSFHVGLIPLQGDSLTIKVGQLGGQYHEKGGSIRGTVSRERCVN